MSGERADAIVFAGLLPHPPIAVPAVAGERGEACRSTTDACRDLADRLVRAEASRLFVVSPHSPRARAAFGLWDGPRLRGDLVDFGAPEAAVDLPADPELAAALEREAAAVGIETWRISAAPLDHGAVVPLSFLAAAGWDGPTCVASLPWPVSPGEAAAFGRALARATSSLAGSTALVASGDMSHRVLPGAPAGHHPRAIELDRAVCAAVEEGDLACLARIDPDLRELAAEDVVDPCVLVAAALPPSPTGIRELSYEHPFGVGYLVAVLHEPR